MVTKLFVENMGGLDRALRAFVVTPVAVVAAFAVGVSSIVGIVLFVVAGSRSSRARPAAAPATSRSGSTPAGTAAKEVWE